MSAPVSVAEALARIFALVAPLGAEDVPIGEAGGRVLARPVTATRDQPPFRTATMDGYAVRGAEIRPGARLAVRGEAAAGHAAGRALGPGEAVRIFTGAPVPDGADRVLIQEDVTRVGDAILVGERAEPDAFIRAAGADFRAGDRLAAPRRLGPGDILLAAAMNHAVLPCTRRPEVAIIATGDELVPPGGAPGPDQIVASNAVALKAMVAAAGGRARLLPIARDRADALRTVLDLAAGADLVVTIGGASVGEHDLVARVAAERGMAPAFHKVAMRPGKPLMAGRLGDVPLIGLPGNPVSALVCGQVFLLPALRVMLGLPAAPAPSLRAPLAAPVAANGPREHYMRAALEEGRLRILERQDSGLTAVYAAADALAIRPPRDPARATGEELAYLPLRSV